jgi:hypothetical protein
VAVQERPQATVRPAGRVFFLDEQDAASGWHGEPAGDGQAEGEAEGLLEGVVGLAELLFAGDPAAAIVRQEIRDVGHLGGEGHGKEVAETDPERAGGRGRRQQDGLERTEGLDGMAHEIVVEGDLHAGLIGGQVDREHLGAPGRELLGESGFSAVDLGGGREFGVGVVDDVDGAVRPRDGVEFGQGPRAAIGARGAPVPHAGEAKGEQAFLIGLEGFLLSLCQVDRHRRIGEPRRVDEGRDVETVAAVLARAIALAVGARAVKLDAGKRRAGAVHRVGDGHAGAGAIAKNGGDL